MNLANLVFGFCIVCTTNGMQDQPKAEVEHLAPLARFIGEWETHGKWAQGGELHARGIYTWGLNRKLMHSKTFVKDDKMGEYQRYEGVFYYKPQYKRVQMLEVAFNGALSESVLEVPDSNTLKFGYTDVSADKPSKVRQLITFTDNDTFVWKVELQSKEGWQQIIEATWRRKKAATAK